MKRRPTKKDRRKAAARDAEIEKLKAENARLRAENAELKARLEKLERLLAKAQKDSSTSSKPPSSDIVKPAKVAPKGRRKREAGGQPGHEKHERTFRPEDADVKNGYVLDDCPNGCASDLVLMPGTTKTHYKYELVDNPKNTTTARPDEFFDHSISGGSQPACRPSASARRAPAAAPLGEIGEVDRDDGRRTGPQPVSGRGPGCGAEAEYLRSELDRSEAQRRTLSRELETARNDAVHAMSALRDARKKAAQRPDESSRRRASPTFALLSTRPSRSRAAFSRKTKSSACGSSQPT